MVVCPQCSRPAEIAPGEHPFCRQCDYPLFWVAPRSRPVVIEEPERGPIGPICVVCRMPNEAERALCIRCGQPLQPVAPRRRRTWEVAAPEEKPRSRRRTLIIGIVAGLIMVTLLSALIYAAWYFLWPRSEWSSITLDQGESSWDISATLNRGIPVMAYVDAGDHTLRIVSCGNALCDAEQAAATYTTVSSIGDNGEGSGTAIAIGVDGRPVIAFRNGDRGALTVAHCGDPRCEDPGAITITEIDPGADEPAVGVDNGGWASMTIGADGLPIIAYHDAARGALKIAHCEDGGCTKATIAVLDRSNSSAGGDGVGTDTVIAIGPDDLPVVAFRDAEDQSLKLARCSDERCTQAVISTVVREPGLDPGHNTSMQLAEDGSPLLVYGDWSATAPGIYYVRCASPSCEAATVRQVDNPAMGESADPALGLDENGLPVVAFRQREPGDERASRILRVVRCNDLDCSSVSAPVDVDAKGRTGYSTVVLRLNDGTIALAYGDATEGSLEFALYR
ncbi:MAG: hypothetical protein KC461_07765 [Dehalococcoidia bacterium]|nr:hypothetical protein [Dehalococcoidia bacterium]